MVAKIAPSKRRSLTTKIEKQSPFLNKVRCQAQSTTPITVTKNQNLLEF